MKFEGASLGETMLLVVVTLSLIDPELSSINMILGLAAEMPTYKGICAGVMA